VACTSAGSAATATDEIMVKSFFMGFYSLNGGRDLCLTVHKTVIVPPMGGTIRNGDRHDPSATYQGSDE
jgi:hypothetical protein